MFMTLGPASLLLLAVAVLSLVLALIAFPRPKRPRFHIEMVTFNDGAVVYYPMKRTMFGWKPCYVEKGVRAYRTYDEARKALESMLTEKYNLEISESQIVKEYG